MPEKTVEKAPSAVDVSKMKLSTSTSLIIKNESLPINQIILSPSWLIPLIKIVFRMHFYYSKSVNKHGLEIFKKKEPGARLRICCKLL